MNQQTAGDQRVNRLAIGVILMCIGLLFLLHNWIPMMHFGQTWPLFILFPVGILLLIWIRRGQSAAPLIFPITLLTFFCLYFLWLNHAGWWHVDETWPNFLAGPGLSFLALYFVRRRSGLLIPALTLLGLAAIFYAELVGDTWFMGIILIAAGVPFILNRRIKPADTTAPNANMDTPVTESTDG